MGVQGLFNSAIALMSGLTNFGLGTSAVKNVAAANGSGNSQRVAVVVKVLRRMVWITGLLGALVTLILSSYLSEISFGNKDYTWGFIWLSITLLLRQISTGQMVILRGMRKISYLAQSSLSGSILGLVFSLPFYYFYGIDGIVPAIIITSIITLLRTWYYAKKIPLDKVAIDSQTTITVGKDMLIMGFMLSLSGLFVVAKGFGIRAFISSLGDIEQVGLYAAGFAIVNTYVGMVFTAMSTDYFPRLSEVAHDNSKAKDLINQQAEIAILILAPIIAIFIVFIPWIIVILYSSQFLGITQMIQWASLGMFFKAISWAMAYIILAKGAPRLFMINELSAGTITLMMHLTGYYFWGLTGIGLGFLAGYIYYSFQVFFLIHYKFEFTLTRMTVRLLLIFIFLGSISLVISQLFDGAWMYVLGTGLIIFTSFISLKQLNTRISVSDLIKKLRKK